MIAGVILAGGQGRRLGGTDKSLLRLGGMTLVAHLIGRLRPRLDRLAISANGDPRRLAFTGLPVLADAEADMGPLAGILCGMAWAERQGCSALLTVPCDTPFVPADLAARLDPAPAVAASGGRVHHAVALWPVGAVDALRDYLRASKRRSIRDFAETLGVRAVAFDAGDVDPFFNINTSQDLAQAALLFGRLAASPPGQPRG